MKIDIAYVSDANFIEYVTIAAASAAFFLPAGHELVIHLVDGGVQDVQWGKFCDTLHAINGGVSIVRHKVDLSLFGPAKGWRGNTMVYARMLLPNLDPDLDWVLCLDGDTLFLGDYSGLFDLRDERYAFQMSVDPPANAHALLPNLRWAQDAGYDLKPGELFCAGVMMMNLKLLRKENFVEKFLDFLKKHSDSPTGDQLTICCLARGKISPLPEEWGIFSFYHNRIDVTRPCLVHFATDVPWKRARLRNLMSDIVLVWHDFTQTVLGLDTLKQIPWGSRMVRRALYVILRCIGCRRDNIRGLTRLQRKELHSLFARGRA